MEKIVVETLCADLAAEGDCPGAAWNALWEWLTDVAAPAAAAEEPVSGVCERLSRAGGRERSAYGGAGRAGHRRLLAAE